MATLMNFMGKEEVIHYDSKIQELHGNQGSKARKLVRDKLVQDNGDGTYRILPIQGYNVSEYRVDWMAQSCTCQYNTTKGLVCSHLIAVRIFRGGTE